MLFMVIERFRHNDILPVHARVRDAGRQLPAGLTYVDSWVEASFGRCFQLTECDDASLLRHGCWGQVLQCNISKWQCEPCPSQAMHRYGARSKRSIRTRPWCHRRKLSHCKT